MTNYAFVITNWHITVWVNMLFLIIKVSLLKRKINHSFIHSFINISIHQRMVHASKLRCMDSSILMYGPSILWSSNVWTSNVWIAFLCMDSVPMYGSMYGPSSDVWSLQCMNVPMVADVGAFQVAEVPMNGYNYTLPI